MSAGLIVATDEVVTYFGSRVTSRNGIRAYEGVLRQGGKVIHACGETRYRQSDARQDALRALLAWPRMRFDEASTKFYLPPLPPIDKPAVVTLVDSENTEDMRPHPGPP